MAYQFMFCFFIKQRLNILSTANFAHTGINIHINHCIVSICNVNVVCSVCPVSYDLTLPVSGLSFMSIKIWSLKKN